tara:strand:- start:1406 stop:1948 length:543 start_codon:yes stop_codon:yes gene_type:complete
MMTKYNPYKGLSPNRGRRYMTRGQRQRWGIIAASAFGFYIWNRTKQDAAISGAIGQGTASSVEFSQTAATALVSEKVDVKPSGTYDLGMTLATTPLNIQVNLTKAERGHTVRVAPVIDGNELSNVIVSTTDGSGVASFTFSAEDMNIIKNSGAMVTNVGFRIVVDGAYADSIMVRCPIGA